MNDTTTSPADEDLELHDQLVNAVRYLHAAGRPDLTLQIAFQEAIGGWLAEQAALHHRDQPFPIDHTDGTVDDLVDAASVLGGLENWLLQADDTTREDYQRFHHNQRVERLIDELGALSVRLRRMATMPTRGAEGTAGVVRSAVRAPPPSPPAGLPKG